MKGDMTASGGEAAYGAGMKNSQLPHSQPTIGAILDDAHEDMTGFITQFITVQGGEDVAAVVMSYCGNGWAVIILSANGAVCNVKLQQPTSRETIVYEGCFDILSLSGVYLPSNSNGLGISLSGPDGSVFGGSLVGPLIAASSVQVVIGLFKAGEKKEVEVELVASSGTPSATTPSGVPSASSSGPSSPQN